ncbi:MAG: helix-turn-helix transcriptional regulator [Erysipelothrix sp.]|jgi:AraC-like DNA-binding protein|nr:helix-turn-helix transcriptional regulator [Erysipelothrix sp.]
MFKDVLYHFEDLQELTFEPNLLDKTELGENIKYQFNQELTFNDTLFFTRWIINPQDTRLAFNFLNKDPHEFQLVTTNDEAYADVLKKEDFSYKHYDNQCLASPFHRNSHIELCYVYRGELKIKVEDYFIILPEKSAMMMDKRLLHSECFDDQDTIVLFLGMNDAVIRNLMYPLASQSKSFIRKALLNEGDFGSYFIVDLSEEAQQFEFYLLSALRELQEKQPGYDLLVMGYYHRLYKYLLNKESRINIIERDEAKQRLLHDVLRYIEYHLMDVNLNDLSKEFKFSRDYFNRLIKEMTGSTFSEYLKEVRLNRAMQLLIETDEDIDKIALKVGYTNKSFFYGLFKDKLNATPSEYRKQRKP